MGMLTDACPSCGCYPEAADMLDAHVRYIVSERDEARHGLRAMHIAADRFLRERDEARAEADRWKAEADKLREAVDTAYSAWHSSQYVGGPSEREAYRIAMNALGAVATQHTTAGGGSDA